MLQRTIEQQFTQVIDALVAEFPEVNRVKIAGLVQAALGRYAQVKVRTFLPILVQREVRERLRDRPDRWPWRQQEPDASNTPG